MQTHEHYEELCALAATGQASWSELADLRNHLAECPDCRCVTRDFAQLSAHAFSAIAAKRASHEVPAGMTARFIARARSKGIAINHDVLLDERRHIRRWFIPVFGATAASVAIIGALTIAGIHLSKSKSANESSLRAGQGIAASLSSPVVTPAPTKEAEMQQEFAAARARMSAMAAKVSADRAALQSANREKDVLSEHLHSLERENAGLRANDTERGVRIAQLNEELKKLRSEKKAGEIASLVQENELQDLRQKLAEREEALRGQQELLARGSDVRDLIVARNLHIIDVHDRDGNGTNQRPFGRIFYTEGKSLIFYAYDLADPRKLDVKISFYAWGERLGADQPVKSLGIFHNDNVNDGRWILTFDDPNVLAQINSVFVTVETATKTVTQPNGKRILFAFLGSKPNHP